MPIVLSTRQASRASASPAASVVRSGDEKGPAFLGERRARVSPTQGANSPVVDDQFNLGHPTTDSRQTEHADASQNEGGGLRNLNGPTKGAGQSRPNVRPSSVLEHDQVSSLTTCRHIEVGKEQRSRDVDELTKGTALKREATGCLARIQQRPAETTRHFLIGRIQIKEAIPVGKSLTGRTRSTRRITRVGIQERSRGDRSRGKTECGNVVLNTLNVQGVDIAILLDRDRRSVRIRRDCYARYRKDRKEFIHSSIHQVSIREIEKAALKLTLKSAGKLTVPTRANSNG